MVRLPISSSQRPLYQLWDILIPLPTVLIGTDAGYYGRNPQVNIGFWLARSELCNSSSTTESMESNNFAS